MIRADAWHAHSAEYSRRHRPEVGEILAVQFAAWRVLDVETPGIFLEPGVRQYVIGAAQILAGGELGKRHIMTCKERVHDPAPYTPHALSIGANVSGPLFQVLKEHYSICGKCGDVQPCREVFGDRQADVLVAEFKRYEMPGICPACEEPITLRQKSIDMPNIVNPLGGVVTFHARSRCVHAAVNYERRLLTAGVIKSVKLSCTGMLIRHRDDTLACLDLDCPDVNASHGNYSMCQYRSHGCPRFECAVGGTS